MAYFYYMDEPTRRCKEPYSQDMGMPRHYYNSYGTMYHTHGDYDVEEEWVLRDEW